MAVRITFDLAPGLPLAGVSALAPTPPVDAMSVRIDEDGSVIVDGRLLARRGPFARAGQYCWLIPAGALGPGSAAGHAQRMVIEPLKRSWLKSRQHAAFLAWGESCDVVVLSSGRVTLRRRDANPATLEAFDTELGRALLLVVDAVLIELRARIEDGPRADWIDRAA